MLEVWNGIAWKLGASDLGRLDRVHIYMRQDGNGDKTASKDDAADDDDDNESDKSIAIKRCYNDDNESDMSLANEAAFFFLHYYGASQDCRERMSLKRLSLAMMLSAKCIEHI